MSVQRSGLLIVKSHGFAKSCLAGLVMLRTQLIISDTDDVYDCFEKLCIPKPDHLDIDLIPILSTLAEGNVIIACGDQEWSYVLYVLIMLYTMDAENIITNLKDIINENQNLIDPSDDVLDMIARIFSNHEINGAANDEIPYESDESHNEFCNTYDKYVPMIAMIFAGMDGLDSKIDNSDSVDPTDSPGLYDVRPPIPPFRGRLVDHIDDTDYLEELDPGIQMPDTSNDNPGEFPDPTDCLGITSYSPYEPRPDEPEPVPDSLDSKKSLAVLEAELFQMMSGKIYNKEYAKDMLHSGMTVDEVYTVLVLSV